MTHYYDKFKNVLTREASKADHQNAQPRYGFVEAYDKDLHLVQCSLTPEETDDDEKILTGWLQICTPMCGPEWGIVSTFEPADGDILGCQVILMPLWNSGSEYVVLGGTFNDVDEPAKGPNDIGGEDLPCEVGEFLLRSKTDFTMKFVDKNTIMLKGEWHKEEMEHIKTKGNDVEFRAAAGVLIYDNLTTKGNVSVGTGASGIFTTQTGQVITVADGIIISIV